jgi:hypothetical protein
LLPKIRERNWRQEMPTKDTMLHYLISFVDGRRILLPTAISKDLELVAAQPHLEKTLFKTPKKLKELRDLRAQESLANDR